MSLHGAPLDAAPRRKPRRRCAVSALIVQQRLDSWKEIAAHLGRRVRTVQRWEREEGLPVHRHAHRRRGTVYAWSDELDAWHDGRQMAPSAAAAAAPPVPRRSRRRALLLVAAAALVAAGGVVGARLRHAVAESASGDSDWALTARYLVERGGQAEVERARDLCSRQLLVPLPTAAAAAAHECLAETTLALVRFGALPRQGGLRSALGEAERSLALDDRRPRALTVAARVHFTIDWDAAAAEGRLRHAIAVAPDSAPSHHALAQLLSVRGRHDEAIAELRQAQRAAPLSAAINDDGCWYFYRARRPREALVEAERALLLEPDRPGALECVVDSRAALGEHDAARDAAVTLLRSEGDAAGVAALTTAPASEAPRLLYRRQLARLETMQRTGARAIPPGAWAFTHAELGEREAAFQWLDRALAERDPVLLLVRVHPAFDSLRGDARLEPLLRRAGV
jgi:tetratricopeptide (TPR) repeat protein